jgi:hypothetical protein
MKVIVFIVAIFIVFKVFFSNRESQNPPVQLSIAQETVKESTPDLDKPSKTLAQPQGSNYDEDSSKETFQDSKQTPILTKEESEAIEKVKKIEKKLTEEAFSVRNEDKPFPTEVPKGEPEVNPYDSFIPSN